MSTNIEASLASIAGNVENIKERFDKLEENIEKNYVTHNSHELLVKKSFDSHLEKNHTSLFSNQKIILIVIVLLTSGAGGAGGDLIRSLIGG